AQELGDVWQVAAACLRLGDHLQNTRKDEAEGYYLQALKYFEQLGIPRPIGMTLGQLGTFNLRVINNLTESRRYFQQMLRFRWDHGALAWELIEAVQKFADFLEADNQKAKSLELQSMIIHHAASGKAEVNWAEIHRAELETQLPSDVYAAAWER